MSDARIGWGGEVHLWDSSLVTPALVQLVEVVSFGLPDEDVDEVEVTHLKSPNKRRQFVAGLSDAGEVEVSLNYIPDSPTDKLIRAAKSAGDVRSVKFVIPGKTGTPAWQITTTAYVSGYSRGPVTAGEKIEATVRLRISGAQTEAVAA